MTDKEFNPNILHPFYFARIALLQAIKGFSKEMSGKILDVGCGQKPYKTLFKYDSYIGMDVEQSGHSHQYEEIDIFYDGKTFPFDDNSFDCVITSQVFEHVFTPDLFIKEIYRVLKPGGKLLLTVPFVWDEHEQPYDYARYSSFGLAYILKENDIIINKHIKTLPDIRVLIQLWNTYIFKLTYKNKWIYRFSRVLVILPFNIIGIILNKLFPKNYDLYLDNVILATKQAQNA